jgi:uncharacterized protein
VGGRVELQLLTTLRCNFKCSYCSLGVGEVLASIDGGEAYSWCRGNCMKNLYNGYVKKNERYRDNVVDPICELIRFMGREINKRSPQAWFDQATLPVRKQITDCEVYEYVEIMP